LIIPKFVRLTAVPHPKEVVKQLNQLLFKFLWKGVERVTRLPAINEYENGGLKIWLNLCDLPGIREFLMEIMVRGKVTYVNY